MKAIDFEAPSDLSPRSQALWESETRPGGRTRSRARALMLEEALRALDQADAWRELIKAEGATVTTAKSGVAHAHALVGAEQKTRALFVKLALALGLVWDHDADGQRD